MISKTTTLREATAPDWSGSGNGKHQVSMLWARLQWARTSCLLLRAVYQSEVVAGHRRCRCIYYITQIDATHLSPHPSRKPQHVRGCLIPLLLSPWSSTGLTSPFKTSFQQVVACCHTKKDVSAATQASSSRARHFVQPEGSRRCPSERSPAPA